MVEPVVDVIVPSLDEPVQALDQNLGALESPDSDIEPSEIDLLPGGRWLNRLLLLLVLAGFGINLLLMFRRLLGDQVVGCGGGSACDLMLVPPWSEIMGIPVAACGAVVYGLVAVSLLSSGRRLLTPLCGVLLGAAIWFLFVQAVLLNQFCNWCLAAHGVGVCLATLALWRQRRDDYTAPVVMVASLVTIFVAIGIAFLQFFGPGVKHRRSVIDTAYSKKLGAAAASGVYSLGEGRKVVLADGRRTFDVDAMPHLGRADAKAVVVMYFDYRCPSCWVMQGFLNVLLAKHPADLCVIVLPAPLERSCNSMMGAEDEEFAGSCKLTQLALAVWRKVPEAFADYHQLLLAGADVTEARKGALELMAAQELEVTLQDPWINNLIQANVRDWAALGTISKKFPKLMIGKNGLLHGLPASKEEFIAEMESALGL